MVLEYRHRTRQQDGPVRAVIVSDVLGWEMYTECGCCVTNRKIKAVWWRGVGEASLKS